MKRLKLAAILTALSIHAYADSLPSADLAIKTPANKDTTINGKISSLGLGAEIVFPFISATDARLGINTFKHNIKKSTEPSPGVVATDYNGDLNLQSLQVMADWHPWQSSFRVTGGLVYNNNKFEMTATPAPGNFIYLNGNKYNISNLGGSASATVEFRKISPYLGIGWGRTPKNTGLSFTSDIGILFQGTPRSSLTTNGLTLVGGGSLALDTAQADAQLRESLKNFNMYPVVSFGIGYSF
jgi:hypothetical protein